MTFPNSTEVPGRLGSGHTVLKPRTPDNAGLMTPILLLSVWPEMWVVETGGHLAATLSSKHRAEPGPRSEGRDGLSTQLVVTIGETYLESQTEQYDSSPKESSCSYKRNLNYFN